MRLTEGSDDTNSFYNKPCVSTKNYENIRKAALMFYLSKKLGQATSWLECLLLEKLLITI